MVMSVFDKIRNDQASTSLRIAPVGAAMQLEMYHGDNTAFQTHAHTLIYSSYTYIATA